MSTTVAEQAADLLALAGRILWAHGVLGLVTTALWGLLFFVVGIALAVVGWIAARRHGWLDLAIARDAWIRGGVLALWLVGIPTALGTAGLVWGAERATLAAIHEERLVERACEGAATAIADPLVRAAASAAGTEIPAGEPCPRVAMRDVWSLRERAHEILDGVEDRLVHATPAAADETEIVTDAKRFVARRVLRYVREEAVSGKDERLTAYLTDVERSAAPDGTVAVEDFVRVLATDTLQPYADALVSDLYASLRWPLYAIVLGLLAIPLGVLALIRFVRRRAAARAAAGPGR